MKCPVCGGTKGYSCYESISETKDLKDFCKEDADKIFEDEKFESEDFNWISCEECGEPMVEDDLYEKIRKDKL